MHDKKTGQQSPPQEKSHDEDSETAHSRASPTRLDILAQLIKVLSIVVGVVMSVASFTSARKHEADVREKEARSRAEEANRYAQQREAESAKPFVVLRQKLYLDAVQVAGVLTNPEDHSDEELTKARKRFRELYVSELSLVEGADVEHGMMELAKEIDPPLTKLTTSQLAAYHLAHSLRNSLRKSWNFNNDIVDNPDR